MTDRTLRVHMDGRLCGELTQTGAGSLSFRYDDEYRASPDSTPLSLSMPLVVKAHPQRAIRPFLEGLLPDSETALAALGRRFAVSPRNPFALLEHMGEDVAGALQILPPDQESSDAAGPQVRWVSEDDVAQLLTRVVDEYESGTPYDMAGRFSLAGAQPKIALYRSEDRWGIPDGSTPTTHILKPAAAGRFRRMDVVEQLTQRAASVLGNRVAESHLETIGEWNVLVSTRYDRERVSGRWHRVHQEDLCQALSVPPAKKYQRVDGGPGIADFAGLIRSFPLDEDRRIAGEQAYRAVVFNTVAGCTDAHAKNYSLLLTGRRVHLAPLYDLATYAGYWDGESSIESAMSVGGQYALRKISSSSLIAEGKRFGLGEEDAAHIVEEIRANLVGAFATAGEELEREAGVDSAVVADVLRGVEKLPLAH